MRKFTDSGASTLLIIAVAFCHLSIFGNWTVRNHLIEKCLHIISASKEDIMCQSMKWKVLLLLQVNLLQLMDFKPQPPCWPFAGLSFEVVTCTTRSFKGLSGSTQQNISDLYSKPIAVLPAPHQSSTIFLAYHSLSQQITAVSVLSL